MDKIQKIGVTAFIFHDNKVLLVRRSQNESFLPGFYEMPGGKIEFGETVEAALKREIMEETNLEIEVVKPYSTFSYTSSNETKHTIDIQFLVKIIDSLDNIKLSKEYDEYQLVAKEEINNYQISDLMKSATIKGFDCTRQLSPNT